VTPPHSPTGIAVRGLTCTYAGAATPALAELSCDVPAGTLTVVMGATGAGKTTLARCLTNIVPCFLAGEVRGEVRLEGEPIAGRRVGELAGSIGMVFQDFEVQLFSSDVTQEIVFGLEQTGVPPAEMAPRVRDALRAVGLASFEGRDPGTLSGGEKQRLSIAGLLALRPPVLVLDEPTTDLDPAGRAEVFAVLAGLRGERLAVLLIEHDVGAAVLADRLVLLRDGATVADGPPEAVLADVDACRAAGVRPHDVCHVFVSLGLADPPLDIAAAAERLRAAGLVPAPPPPEPAPRRAVPVLRVEGLGHRFADGREALAEVSFTIGRGELVAVIGRNGSGKTTLARHLNALLRPTAGRVLLDGRDLAALSLEEVAQRVGYVFQDPDHQLFAERVRDEVAFGPRNVGLSAAEVERRVDEALDAVGLDARDADPFLLDKGARQRLAVAAVLALSPDVLVLDEPTTGLDWPQQLRMLELLRALQRAGRTVVIITHTPWVIAEYAERVLLLAGGRLRYDGPVRGFFAEPARVAEAAFHPPDVTRLGQALGCTPLSVEELVSWMPGRGT
jgi:energy-coupling factor transport system ATP-binding protein